MRCAGLAVIAAAAMVFAPVHARAAEPRLSNVIEVTAQSQVEVPADLALVDFGVVTQAESAGAAATQNAERMKAVLAAVRKIVDAEARISTSTYAIRPIYASVREGGAPRVTGYEVSNVVHLKTRVLGRVAEVIDAAVRAGANQVQRLAFTLSDDSAAGREALRNAVLKAREKAETIAAALGVRMGAVHSVSEQEIGPVRPLVRQAAAMHAESAPLTPVEPGQVEVRARVVLRMEIAHPP